MNERTKNLGKRQLLAIALVLSACSIMYELLIAKAIAKFCGSIVLWESLTIGIYIGFLGVGVFFYSIRQRNTIQWLYWVEFILTILGSTSIVFLMLLHIIYRIYVRDDVIYHDLTALPSIYYFGVTAQIPTILIGFFSGMELPALLDFAKGVGNRDRTNLIIGLYYIGALIGTLIFGLILLPHADITTIAVGVASFNLLVLIILMFNRGFSFVRILSAVIALAVIIGCASKSEQLSEYQIKNTYYNKEAWITDHIGKLHIDSRKKLPEVWDYLDKQPPVERHKSLYQHIDIVPKRTETVLKQFRRSFKKGHRNLHLDGHFQLASENELEYHEHLAHIPVQLFSKIPKNVLVLGGGDGALVRELLRYNEQIETITLVEIDPKMVELATSHEYLLTINKGALKDPKVTVIIDDAFRYLRWDKRKYDAIYIDFPYPFNFDSLRLYSVEMARLVARRVAPGGFAAMDAPMEVLRSDEFTSVLYNTYLAGGFETIIAFKSRLETFATFTTDKREPNDEFFDVGFDFDTIEYGYMKSFNTKVFTDEPDSDLVNSLLKPKLFGKIDRSF